MWNWILENAGTLFVGLILMVIVGLVIFSIIKRAKAPLPEAGEQTHGACGSGCSHCPMRGICH